MPYTVRGELPKPTITAIQNRYTRPPSDTIDTDVFIELAIDAPNCQLFFTTDGARPVPFKRYMGAREVTFKYRGPFSLRSGKRTVRAVAIHRDKLLESPVVSRTFVVHGNSYDSTDSDGYYGNETSDVYWDSDTTNRSRTVWKPCRSWSYDKSPTRSRPASADQGWLASTRRYPYVVETQGSQHTDERQEIRIPDGPFNPINYSGTQINVWGSAPGGVWPTAPGVAAYPGVAPKTRFPVQHGLLTRDMIQSPNRPEITAADDDNNKPLTVADVRRILTESETDPSPAEQSDHSAKKSSRSSVRSGSVHKGSVKNGSIRSGSVRNGSIKNGSVHNGSVHNGSVHNGETEGVRDGTVSFSGLARSGKALLSNYREKKCETE